ncbi:MAG: hypothetical protein Q8K93_31810 [Reyranella sp.]|uniref:hypothetical protein n=1 Tax=Reyranella sp. TaxID=1929291 RepID=UPI0027320D61|nr:hypothetical protein [Reyranella sp.]MDP1966778.1 hypothetical protein [Reyranella sp.]MDP2375993.1 hypothetical protein [Reyranella sp.]
MAGFLALVVPRAEPLFLGLLVVVFFVAMVAGLPRAWRTMPSLPRATIQAFECPDTLT